MDDRTKIAAMALQGLLANPNQNINVWDPGLTDVAVGYADDLLRHLDAIEPGETTEFERKGGDPHEPAAPRQAVQEAVQATVRPQAIPHLNLRDYGISGRACAPLERMGVETLAQLAVQTRADISKVRGVSVDTLKELDALLGNYGLTWDYKLPEPQDEDTPEEEGEDDEDDLL